MIISVLWYKETIMTDEKIDIETPPVDDSIETNNAEEKTKNTQLQTEIKQLRNRPVHTNTYIENEYINQQHNYSQTTQ